MAGLTILEHPTVATSKSDEKQFVADVKRLAVDSLHEAHTAAGARAALKPSDILNQIDAAFPTFLKLYQVAGGLLIPAYAKPAADLFVTILKNVKDLADQTIGGAQPDPA